MIFRDNVLLVICFSEHAVNRSGGNTMKKLLFVSIFLAFIFSFNTSFSQPKLIIHLTGGYSLPLGGLAGNISDLYAEPVPQTIFPDPKMYEKTGFLFGGDIKYAFDRKRSIRGVLGFCYSMFFNSHEVNSSFFPAGTLAKRLFRFFTISLGTEYALFPERRVSPFIGIDVTENFYNGYVFKYDPEPPNISHPYIKWEAGSRYGLQFGAGMDIALNRSRSLGIIVGAKYHLINLFGKAANYSYDFYEQALVDKEHTSIDEFGNPITVNAMNLQSINFYAGISFSFMQPKTINKKK